MELRAGNTPNTNPGSSPLKGPFLQSYTLEVAFSLELWTESIGWGPENDFATPSQNLLKSSLNLAPILKF